MSAPATWKLVFIGEPGAGKSTCINAVSDFPAVSTDVDCTDELAKIKKSTTVALDYGEMNLAEQGRLLLYGLPGQSRFSFMMDTIRDGLAGVVLLVDAQSHAPILGLTATLDTYAGALAHYPLVVAINKSHENAPELRRQAIAVLRRYRLVAPVLSVDARRREDMARIFDLVFLCAEHA